jgi:type III secretion protein U
MRLSSNLSSLPAVWTTGVLHPVTPASSTSTINLVFIPNLQRQIIAMSDESESKPHPASERKLREARLKGQVPHSRDFVSAFTLACLSIYLLFALPALADRLVALMTVTPQLADRPFAEASGRVVGLALDVLLLTTLPPVVIVVVGVAVSGVASTFGPVFSFDPVHPDFDRINPAQTMKMLFSSRNVIETVKALVKVAVLAAAFVLIMRGAIGPLFETPVCGEPCLLAATLETVKLLLAAATAAFLVIGVLDLLVQRRLFQQDMRMSHSEQKRETKDQQGDPEIRKERRRLRSPQGAFGGKVRVGIQYATVVLKQGSLVVGLRYKKGHTPVPAVVCKGAGEAGAALLAEARRRGTPIVEQGRASAIDFVRCEVGDFIDPDLFEAAAWAIVASGTEPAVS